MPMPEQAVEILPVEIIILLHLDGPVSWSRHNVSLIKLNTLTAALCPTSTFRNSMFEGVFMSHTAMVRSWGMYRMEYHQHVCTVWVCVEQQCRHMRDNYVKETCSTLYLGAGHHHAGLELEVEYSLKMMLQCVYQLTRVDVPHSGGRRGGGEKGGGRKEWI